ncbi:phage tail protein [Pseudomonas sp. P2757]|uniref:phage tail protein n=1 Tax=Pseudomonas sp. P2757 TaxID=3409917 RepID=UPI003B5ABD04
MADYYTLLTNAGIAYETACKAAGTPIKLTQISVGDGGEGGVYNPAATATELRREVWRGPLNALFQDEKNPSWLLAEVTIPPDVGGWYVREAGLWTDTGVLYAIVKYPESFKPVLATSGSGKEFYIRSIFETSNASLVTLLIDDTVVKATRAWVAGYVADELAKLDAKQSVRVATTTNIVLTAAQTIDGVAVVAGDRVLAKNQTLAKDNGIYVVANTGWTRAKDADTSLKVTSGLLVSVEQGATQADTIWQLITDGAVVLDATALTFQNITFGFAPLKSPTFLDSPAAPTQAQFNNSKLLATTEFVQRALGSYADLTTYPGSVDLTAGDVGKLIAPGGSASIVTLPDAGSVPQGSIVTVLAGLNGATFKAKGGQTLIAINGAIGPFTQPQSTVSAFRRLSNGLGWTMEGGDGALKYSPIMSGAHWITAPQFDNGKTFATTEFVQRAQGSFSGQTTIQTLPATLTPAMAGRRIVVSGPGVLTLPLLAASPVGSKFYIFNMGAADITVVRQGTDSISVLAKTLTSFTIQSSSNAVVTCGDVNHVVEEGCSALKYSNEFAALFSLNGYQKNPSGLIEQWGGVPSIPANGSVVLTYPIAFPGGALGFALAGGASGPGIPGINVYSLSTTQARFWNQSTTVATQAGGYRVVGY